MPNIGAGRGNGAPPERPEAMKVAFVCEEVPAPPFVKSGGSSPVYASVLKALASRHEVYGIFIGDEGDPDGWVRSVCRDHIVIPGDSPLKPLKLARHLARRVTGRLQAPPWLEEFGRGGTKQRIRAFLGRHNPDVLIVSWYHCIKYVGRDVVGSFPGVSLIDIHDDVVERERLERQVLTEMLARYPVLKRYPRYRLLAAKHGISGFSYVSARREELRALSTFDGVLCANGEDAAAYRERLPAKAVVHCPWPVFQDIEPATTQESGAADLDRAGCIASDMIFQLEGMATFIEQVLPAIRRERPDFRFAVAGTVCKPLALVFPDAAERGVILRGFVPDVADFYRSVGTVAVPTLTSTGVSIKVLEAVAHGVRLVSTPAGVRGIDARDLGPNVSVAADLAGLAAGLLSPPDREPGRRGGGGMTERYLSRFHAAVASTAGSLDAAADRRQPQQAAAT
ncbi:MAG TPA: glycosyltransferase [Stellaceae bacterium]